MIENIEVVESQIFSTVIAEEIATLVSQDIAEKGSCSIALAGGTTPGAVYRALTTPPQLQEIDWKKVSIYWGDERWVPKVSPQSNYHMVEETLLSRLGESKPTVYPIDFDSKSAEAAAKSYEKTLIDNLGSPPAFDLVLLGLGEDGHFASVFPNSSLLNDKKRYVAEALHPNGQERISLTPKCIEESKKILFLVTGERKASVIKRLFEGEDPASELPARYFTKEPKKFPNLRWFLDSESASSIS